MTPPRLPLRHGDTCARLASARAEETQVVCRAGHAPRFHQPRSPTDESWGDTRHCRDVTPGRRTP